MTDAEVHIEDVLRALAATLAIALVAGMTVAAASLAAGLTTVAALALGTSATAAGALSGGFGLAVRMPRLPGRRPGSLAAGRPAPALRVPAPR